MDSETIIALIAMIFGIAMLPGVIIWGYYSYSVVKIPVCDGLKTENEITNDFLVMETFPSAPLRNLALEQKAELYNQSHCKQLNSK